MVERSFLHSLPQNPGVYIMRNAENKIIYVGKAKNLKNRVNQYFVKNSNHTEKVLAMVSHVHHIEYILTNSEIEALNLECSLIKKNRPKYNILLKDDKGYPYIKITNETFPRVLLARRVEQDNAVYFGPFTSATVVKQILEAFNKLFRLRQCARFAVREKPCLNYHIKRCEAPCVHAVSAEAYAEKINYLKEVLSGKPERFSALLKQKMVEASENLNFETAADYRDKITALNHIMERQLVVSVGNANEDIIYLLKQNDRICIQILYVRGGNLSDKQSFFINNPQNEAESEIMRSFLLQYYEAFEIPKMLYVSCEVDEGFEIEAYLSSKRGNKVTLHTPKRGDKLHFMEMARKNAEESMRLKYVKSDKNKEKKAAIEQLAHYLSLGALPHRIEAYDISHTAGSLVVASMVVFIDGVPAKQQYRKFKMKNSLKNDDYAAMKEVLNRRLQHLEAQNDLKFGEQPNLIFVDGGIGQVHAAQYVLKKFNLQIPLFGIYKDDKHKTNGIVGADRIYEIPRGTKSFSLITEIQDEMHRVAISYHRLLRRQKNLESEILEIQGVGKTIYLRLMEKFKTVQGLKQASVSDFAEVRGVSRELAERIFMYMKSKDNPL